MQSCDVKLDDQCSVHLSIIPKLGLIVINELQDFAENWLQVKVVGSSFDVTPLAGHGEESIQAASRYFVDVVLKNLNKNSGPSMEQIGPLMKFMLNVNLKPEILNNRSYITAIGKSLEDLVSPEQWLKHAKAPSSGDE